MRFRLAVADDVPALEALIVASMRGLSAGHYTAEQVERALRDVLGVDTQLIADGTYHVVDHEGTIIAAGGWSGRRTRYGGDHAKSAGDPRVDPTTEPARIRAFYVHPAWARRGLARRLYARCEAEARAAGFRRFELVATLPGEPLYAALGFTVIARETVALGDGLELACVRMGREL